MKLSQWIKNLSFMLSIPVLTIIYRFLNKPDDIVYCLTTGLDNRIPFLKIFILPYLGFYPFVFLVMSYFCYKDRNTYFKTLLAVNSGYLVSFLTYYLFQTTVPRPIATGSDLLSYLVAFVYSSDKPYNAFPSIHVLTSFLMIKASNRSDICGRTGRLLIHSFAILVIVSTQLVKQHVVLDLVSAILLGNVVFEFVYYLFETNIAVQTWAKLLFMVQSAFFRNKEFKFSGKLTKQVCRDGGK